MTQINSDQNIRINLLVDELMQCIDILEKDGVKEEDYYILLYMIYAFRNEEFLEIFFPNLLADEGPWAESDFILEKFPESFNELPPEFSSVEFVDDEYTLAWVADNVSPEALWKILEVFGTLDLNLFESSFKEIYDKVLFRINRIQKEPRIKYQLTKEFCETVLKAVELPEKARVFNVVPGNASFGLALPENCEYYGHDDDELAASIGQYRLHSHFKSHKKFSILDYQNHLSRVVEKSKEGNDEKEDLIISCHPFTEEKDYYECGIDDFDIFLYENLIERLKDDGKFLMVVPDGLLRFQTYSLLRESMIENDLIETIISFPEGILDNRSRPFSVIVLNKAKKIKKEVHFIDGYNYEQGENLGFEAIKELITSKVETSNSKTATIEKINELGQNLSVPLYLNEEVDGETLYDFTTIYRGDRKYNDLEGKVVKISDLSTDFSNFRLNLTNLKDDTILKNVSRISKSCVLVSQVGDLRPTYFEKKDEDIFIGNHILALEFGNNKIDVGYLINELRSEYVTKQVEAYKFGSRLRVINSQDLMLVKVKILEETEQKAKIQGVLEGLAEEKKKELELFNKIHGLESEIAQQNSYLRHKLAGSSKGLKVSLENIKLILENKICPELPGLFKFKLSEDHVYTLGEYLEHAIDDSNKIFNAMGKRVKNINKEIKGKELSKINLKKLTSTYFNKIEQNATYKFKINYYESLFIIGEDNRVKDYENISIMANEDLLTELFDNLISNAVNHAFISEGGHLIEVNLTVRKDNAVIEFGNSGAALPENFSKEDFIRKGTNFGKNAGDGFGGWYINEIVKKHNGTMDIKSVEHGYQMSNIVTQVNIKIPLIEDEI